MPDCSEFLLSRRSVRKFTGEPVPEELVRRALELARFAPSAHNRQPWRFYVVRDKSKLEHLARIHRWSKPIEGAQLAIAVFSDSSASPDSHLVDGSIAATYLWLALHCVGLTTVWIYTLNAVEEIRRILGAPSNLYPIAIFPVGFPAESPPPRPRKPLEELVVNV
ncbi:nitroreductase family protein [Infirmifilum sp. NZ]|uniref:nitroreductase family protein n=1 Tax=Infirmifilum sp. NZ TaxID=2926850 RepID=UPI0027A2DA59|nr:nitroreductase family protein [Infirmifilum sp. NZ]UNQ73829.1 nitroreductase family protein [Infirmifilum sp. NZ]